jgi:RNA polymerase sigma-70 factor (ECF subfamily)
MPDTLTEADFVRLLTSHQRRLHRYIAVFLPSPADAEDVLQETNAVLWKKAKQFTPGTSFLAWARAVARFEIIEYCRRNTFRGMMLSPDLLETVSDELAEEPADDRREEALRQCLDKLSPRNQKLIVERYDQSLPVKEIADRHHRPAGSIYRSLEQIRMVLLECISRTLSAEEHQP